MKKIFKSFAVALLISFLGNHAYAQLDVLLVPSETEKTELKRLLGNYQSFTQLMATSKNAEERKAQSIKFLKESLTGAEVQAYNDLDSSAKPEDLIKFLVYINKLQDLTKAGISASIEVNKAVYEKIKYDKWRRFYFEEIKVVKTFSVRDIKEKRILKTDSVSGKADSISVYDTLISHREVKLSFFIKFERENNISKNFKIMFIGKEGAQPKFAPLPPYQVWWSTLDPEWKTFLTKNKKLDEYPRESEIERVTWMPELNFVNAQFKNYEPLAMFINVSKMDVSGSNIKSIEPLAKMTGLKILTITKTAITDLSGIESLQKLEELYCAGLKLTSIAPVGKLVNLVKFDCSENDLDDISAVKDLINLKDLNVSLNIKLKDINAVRGLVNMEKISFRKIEIKDLSPVAGMKNLVYLDCYNTGIISLEPIRNMQKIFHLDISSNKITSLDPIRNYKYLMNLYMSSSSVVDISVIDNFYNLRELTMAGCPQIKSLGGIHKLLYLRVLTVYYTGIGKDEIQRFKKNHPDCAITYY